MGTDGARHALNVLADYAERGPIGHMRTHATSQLAKAMGTGDRESVPAFDRLIDDPLTRYWAIDGLLKSNSQLAYPKIIAIALDKNLPLHDRSNAVKQLALASKQLFDRGLPSDPGQWKESDLRLDEVRDWAADDYREGPGYPLPRRDRALDHPVTELEQIVSRLDSKLSASRETLDPANPHNCLVPAAEEVIRAIRNRWNLPPTYMEFLARFSPLRVQIDDERFCGGLCLYGADELFKRQIGYSLDAEGKLLPGWPDGYVVIADDGADPFVLDTSEFPVEAPVLSAEHGMGTWDFVDEAPSFEAFLAELA
ncbi:MAG: SMI1/KNR4 family protein [Phycisphaerales bacterium]|nr:SMI1/KNR4 family protein [Phycisphaerales bacterium]MCB9857174.1 SMI1/KNR4 family protein [Phycisphaerales bacterium]